MCPEPSLCAPDHSDLLDLLLTKSWPCRDSGMGLSTALTSMDRGNLSHRVTGSAFVCPCHLYLSWYAWSIRRCLPRERSTISIMQVASRPVPIRVNPVSDQKISFQHPGHCFEHEAILHDGGDRSKTRQQTSTKKRKKKKKDPRGPGS